MTAHEAKILLTEARKCKVKFTKWEGMFMHNMQFEFDHAKLSPRQIEVVKQIYAKATGGGQFQNRIKI